MSKVGPTTPKDAEPQAVSSPRTTSRETGHSGPAGSAPFATERLSREQIEAHRLYLRRAMQRLGRQSEPFNEALCDMALESLTVSAERAINQCDGCARGLPMRGALKGSQMHYDTVSGFAVMTCTADRYGGRGQGLHEPVMPQGQAMTNSRAENESASAATALPSSTAASTEECAKACELIGKDWRDAGDYRKADAAEYMARYLRSLKILSTPPIDRSEAVNLARNWLDETPGVGGWDMTNRGVRSLAEAVMRMDEYIRSLPSANACGWISVSERRPEANPLADEVLGYTLTGHVVTVHPNRIESLYKDAQHTGEDCFYTHWMPLPKGPQQARTDRTGGYK